MDIKSGTTLPKVGQNIKDRENPDDTYRVDKIAGEMISYSGPSADGEIRSDAFSTRFEIVEAVVKLRVRAEGVDCPHCDCWVDGFIHDPRGHLVECDSCGESFQIDTEVEFI